jgi:Tol biopolymer transport system component
MLLLAGALAAQVTGRVNVSSLGAQTNLSSDLPPRGDFVSADGRFVVFTSQASNLVPGDTNSSSDLFIRDRQTGKTDRLSVDSLGHQCNGGIWLFGIAISTDGRYVAYYGESNNLVPGDTNGVADVFLRDRVNGTTERVSLASSGAQANGRSEYPAISDDGRYVVFDSSAANLVAGDTNGFDDVFVRDRVSGTTERLSCSSGGAQGDGYSLCPTISADGRFVAFTSTATNLVNGDTNGFRDVFVRDRQTGTTERVSVATGGGQSDGNSALFAKICGSGRYVVFASQATNLVLGDTNATDDVFVHDRQTGTTVRVSTGPGDTQANGYSSFNSISATGQFVAFSSNSTNLIPGAFVPGGIFVHDLLNDTIDVASVSTTGTYANASADLPSISADGRYVVFRTAASNLVPGDTNSEVDIFIHDRLATGFTSLCDPGNAGVLACPCGNLPSGPTRGCENSSSTGGASLSATGYAYLSFGSLAFVTSNEKPTAISILVQGSSSIPTGVVFGQGVRCIGGVLQRLFVKTATHGSITAPDLSAGDATLPARSRALGVPILAGEEHFYLVYYRDPIVLGACPASSTFNSTQTGRVTWWP